MIETIDLYIRQDELDVRLISLIMVAFDGESLMELLNLRYPFKRIEMIGVTLIITDGNDIYIQETPDDNED